MVLQDYYKKITECGYDVDICFTKRPDHAREIVEDANRYDIVYSMGGDGTLNEVVNGNIKRHDRMAVCPLPMGSCNDVASMLGYTKSPLENLDLALHGDIREIDIGMINGKAFTYVAGMGKFMHIPYETARERKSKSGYLAYIREGIKEFFQDTKRYKTKIVLDGIELEDEYSLIIISNSNHIAGVPEFYKDVKLDDGQLEVLLCKSKNRGDLVNTFIQFFLGNHTKNLISIKANDIDIKFSELPEKNWCIDGEKLEKNSLHYHISANDKKKKNKTWGKGKKIFKKETLLNPFFFEINNV